MRPYHACVSDCVRYTLHDSHGIHKGPLWETRSGGLARCRCRVGHAFTAETIAESQAEHAENAMWTVINSMQESAKLYACLATIATKRHRTERRPLHPAREVAA
jgi:two-component system, chemotaxis family, protein-glutamate methylesterase/glutaminase